jgi:hypothetical protein
MTRAERLAAERSDRTRLDQLRTVNRTSVGGGGDTVTPEAVVLDRDRSRVVLL